ncbi:GNAT family N-acetyltransferase [cf. Phormidesmis sp. LEGE 11477]|uniref:GNAT family N-acetyltransferase n=1 Tax=cf. Phormidesmis sp. LEGE 11477 TaxID=1828680 RepID=UPI001880E4FF|nr:GNAT family N-acetyltransferase [cf. Phormidesmis sp. LEGE 11477]MBE9063675.1 GNAT family N-acetyltransferase [cf. Phormidesmis sp. LEGE 11477]
MDAKFKDFWIRDWVAGDRDEAANVVRTVLTEYGLGWEVSCGGCSDQDAVEVEKYYQQTGGEFWVVERDRTIVGTGGYYPIEREPIEREQKAVEIRKMYLLPDVRGYGLGRFLLSQLEQAAAKAGFLEVWVETATALKTAVRLYERNGYQPESSVDTERCDKAYRKKLS